MKDYENYSYNQKVKKLILKIICKLCINANIA
jgi:hypothetical protein